MRLPWQRKQKQPVPFGDLTDLTLLRHHATRAFCGVLMDRHDNCMARHPTCGVRGHYIGDPPDSRIGQITAVAAPQVDGNSQAPNPKPGFIGIWLTRNIHKCAEYGEHEGGEIHDEETDAMSYIATMYPRDTVPYRKLMVEPQVNGIYPVRYGHVLSPTEGDYASGRLDPSTATAITDCNPEPEHCRWRYWESMLPVDHIPDGKVPQVVLHAVQVNGEWWVAERGERQMQQVAGLDWTNHPRHLKGSARETLNSR